MDLTEMRKYSLSKMQERPATPIQYQTVDLQNYPEIK